MKLLVIADDLTGALDTGVKLAKRNISTIVALDYREISHNMIHSFDVIVIDTDSRHIKADKAAKHINIILEHFKNLDAKAQYIYKKTDSALRGNIGSELDALLHATEFNELHFIPALPDFNRITIDGIHYINGKRLSESIFAKDPFEPVKHSSVKRIIESQSNLNVVTTKACIESTDEKKIIVYDAATNDDILDIACCLYNSQRLNIMAGCAGFINVLPDILKFDKETNREEDEYGAFLAVCGSINPITKSQVEFAIKNGFANIKIQKDDLESIDNYWDTTEGKEIIENIRLSIYDKGRTVVYLDSLFENNYNLNNNERFKIAKELGKLIQILVEDETVKNVLVTGGDTLRGLCNVAEVKTLIPSSEIIEGMVKSQVTIGKVKSNIISKSGGFGNETAFYDIANILSVEGLMV